MILAMIGLVILLAVTAAWVYRAILIYLPSTRGPVLSSHTIPDAPDPGLVSVIVPAKDEQDNIGGALETLLAPEQNHPHSPAADLLLDRVIAERLRSALSH